jgi:hypothetical protein
MIGETNENELVVVVLVAGFQVLRCFVHNNNNNKQTTTASLNEKWHVLLISFCPTAIFQKASSSFLRGPSIRISFTRSQEPGAAHNSRLSQNHNATRSKHGLKRITTERSLY